MKIAFFSVKPYEETALRQFNQTFHHELVFYKESLTEQTTSLAVGFPAVSGFANDRFNSTVLTELAQQGTKLVALRSAGYDHVDLQSAGSLGITVMRVPSYSPHAISEYTIGMLLALDRHIPAAWDRVRAGNFDLSGFTGHGIRGQTVGIIGTGKIGAEVAKTLKLGFGCIVLANDLYPNDSLKDIGVKYVGLEELLQQSDIVSLNCPLTWQSKHLINAESLGLMKKDALLVNTSRGGLIDSIALSDALEAGKIRGCALDVYEGEGEFFFKGPEAEGPYAIPIAFKHLASLPNVIITGHQAFLTLNAIEAIAKTTLKNAHDFESGCAEQNVVMDKYLTEN
ncbi:hypothetical protein AJ78_01618 [Emergomyces pasteurianus Ep9510]|uniref:D-lactate dehydrogenase n=1 Tax=Emergomyces pasteurianus Ep9510 TaxID=1447872 RepID=A0A1J9PQA7_9EURO|nr:hypothetical protein AJ78_01618 [Emergomyces pasteurianus Ep9510]